MQAARLAANGSNISHFFEHRHTLHVRCVGEHIDDARVRQGISPTLDQALRIPRQGGWVAAHIDNSLGG